MYLSGLTENNLQMGNLTIMFNLFTFTVSFDVESLFTNLPLNECIDLGVKYISEGNPGLKLSENELKGLFGFATNETHFPFKGKLYDQMDSVAMGYPSLLFSLISKDMVGTTQGFRGIILSSLRGRHILLFITLNMMPPFSLISSKTHE